MTGNELGESILILVNETLYPKIADELAVLEYDLKFEGYNAILSSLKNGLTPPEVKSIIKLYYEQSGIKGCILIGDIPVAYSEIRTGDYSNPNALKIYISLDAVDMYYMDLDGYWEHVEHPDFYAHMPENVAEVYLYPSCETFHDEYIVYLNETLKWDYNKIENKTQYKAEIWVSRIMAHNLAIPGKDEATLIKDFLKWDHNFRTKQTTVENHVYLLNSEGPGYNEQNMDYSSLFHLITKKDFVTESEYLAFLGNPNGSKLLYLTAHSAPQGHVLHDDYLDVNELAEANKTSVFYILNACSACRWDQYIIDPISPNYLGGIYVFDNRENRKNYGLGAIGFTGVGGFNFLGFFSDYLSSNPGSNYGEAYKYWFNENLIRIFGVWNYVYLGDPTIGPNVPDEIQPTTLHDYNGEWQRADFIINLTAIDNTNRIKDTYYRINNGPIKCVSIDGQPLITIESENNTLEFWSVDWGGNEEVPHKILIGIKLDKTKPLITFLGRVPSGSVEPDQPVKVLINASDSLSGVGDAMLSYCVGDSSSWIDTPITFNATSGLYEVIIQVQQANVTVRYKITVYDNAGNFVIEDNNGQYYIYTVIPEFPSVIILLTLIALITATIVLWRRTICVENTYR